MTKYRAEFSSPLGTITGAADGTAITGIWFVGQKYFGSCLTPETAWRETLPVFWELRRWLEKYFLGEAPSSLPPLRPEGTEFQRRVWAELLKIPRGAVMTYGQIAEHLTLEGRRTSARAVGNAVGRNPISILIPCHRVVGADGALTGYAGGLPRKAALLELEGFNGKTLLQRAKESNFQL